MQVLIRQAPERAQQCQQEERFLVISAWSSTGTRWQQGWAAVSGDLNSQPAQGEQMQPGHNGKRIEAQRRTTLAWGALIGWRRDWNRAFKGGKNHGLTSFGQVRPATGDQPT
ncbi:MAG TPA: hypothetical protein VFN11_01705 [Ktedonobacterales bacterium]|nr:hypothetical protein [Ktedonobacterales bacterium]